MVLDSEIQASCNTNIMHPEAVCFPCFTKKNQVTESAIRGSWKCVLQLVKYYGQNANVPCDVIGSFNLDSLQFHSKPQHQSLCMLRILLSINLGRTSLGSLLCISKGSNL